MNNSGDLYDGHRCQGDDDPETEQDERRAHGALHTS